jgi:hypothetical protein
VSSLCGGQAYLGAACTPHLAARPGAALDMASLSPVPHSCPKRSRSGPHTMADSAAANPENAHGCRRSAWFVVERCRSRHGLPCRRSRVRVPSSASRESPAKRSFSLDPPCTATDLPEVEGRSRRSWVGQSTTSFRQRATDGSDEPREPRLAREPLGVLGERPCARERAEEVRRAVVPELTRCAFGIDGHPTHRVDGKAP